jgi:hypothetical protein
MNREQRRKAAKDAAKARGRGASRMQLVKCYDHFDELFASATEPLPVEARTHQLNRMWGGLAALEKAETPSTDDWRVCSDAVNLLETLVTHNGGYWLDCQGDVVQLRDESGLLMDAIKALAEAGRRHREGKALRLDAAGIVAVRSVMEDYSALVEVLTARTMVKAHRLTEQRIHDILQGRKKPADAEVIEL